MHRRIKSESSRVTFLTPIKPIRFGVAIRAYRYEMSVSFVFCFSYWKTNTSHCRRLTIWERKAVAGWKRKLDGYGTNAFIWMNGWWKMKIRPTNWCRCNTICSTDLASFRQWSKFYLCFRQRQIQMTKILNEAAKDPLPAVHMDQSQWVRH